MLTPEQRTLRRELARELAQLRRDSAWPRNVRFAVPEEADHARRMHRQDAEYGYRYRNDHLSEGDRISEGFKMMEDE